MSRAYLDWLLVFFALERDWLEVEGQAWLLSGFFGGRLVVKEGVFFACRLQSRIGCEEAGVRLAFLLTA